MKLTDRYEKMIRSGIAPLNLPVFIAAGSHKSYCGGQFILQAIEIMQREAGKATREELSRIKENDDKFWQDVAIEDKRYSASFKAKLRLTLLHTTLFADCPSPVWTKASFGKLLGEHLTHNHTLQEIQHSADEFETLLRQEAARMLQVNATPLESVDVDDETLPYHDLQSAMKHFRKREQQIEQLDIADEDKEMIHIRLSEKRSQVLDEFIDG